MDNFSQSSIVIAAKSFPPSISTRQVTATLSKGTNLSNIIFPFKVFLELFKH